MGFGENVAKVQRGTIDRISELPEFILHTILSMLDTEEAGRASVLSKRWYDAWSSIPVLNFHYFQKYRYGLYDYNDDANDRLVGFIDKTMERYFRQKYRITKMCLTLPKVDEKLKPLVDKWIMIAVQNQIQKFEIQLLGGRYGLPEILFSAKSLKYLKCSNVELPYYATMDLVSLEYLTLLTNTLDEGMLQEIISFSPLVELYIAYDKGFKTISLPWMKKVNGGVESHGNGTMQSNLQEYPLQKFVYIGLDEKSPWPWNLNVAALKNLRNLEFECAPITDDIVSELSYGLVVLESLKISACSKLECINISSNSLKQLEITDNSELKKATIDAPKLLEFYCICEVGTSLSLIRALDHCNARFLLLYPDSVTNVWPVALKKFLVETNFFKSLEIEFTSPLEMVVEEDQLRNAGTGLPYKLRELKLFGTRCSS
ncbi:F-box/LRR-repeat protein At3g03360-like isoform X2 [Silene latifolia]|uniref:F-box/LRR-repeat protein At3g03360-like isoform X2 n=1 Tax=Silene latifolia TaxID=37657 RepID=UPI003D76DDD8